MLPLRRTDRGRADKPTGGTAITPDPISMLLQPPHRELAEWNKLPFSEQERLKLAERVEAGDLAARKITRDWTRQFKEKYARVKQLAR